jgi:hypothetical protein
MTGLKSQRKGRANELQITKDFKAAGFDCRTHGQWEALDATVVIDGEPWPIEAKREAKCAPKAYAALVEGDAKLFIQQADRKPRLVTMLWEDFLFLAANPIVNLEITEKGEDAIRWLNDQLDTAPKWRE